MNVIIKSVHQKRSEPELCVIFILCFCFILGIHVNMVFILVIKAESL